MRKKRGIVKRRDTGMNYEISRHHLPYEKAIENVCRIFEAENYRQRTIREYRRHRLEFFEIVGKENVFDLTKEDVRKYLQLACKYETAQPVQLISD
jgi:integrase/recombinase XerD